MTEQTNGLTYAMAGVDIDAGNELVERIKPAAKSTTRPGVMDGLGGFGALFDLKAAGFEDPILVAATDGVGTKLRIAIDTNKLDTVGIDLVAMCVNDLICQGATPLFFLDYFAAATLDIDQASQVINGIAEGCRQAHTALIGGETAEMPGMYTKGDFDLAGFAVGAMERGAALPASDIAEGDILIGLPSSGIHSNGFSLVRKIIEIQRLDWESENPFGTGRLCDMLLEPTVIYVRPALDALATGHLKALAHITGGGLTENLPRALPDDLGASIDLNSWARRPLFDWLIRSAGLSDTEALKTFNCGIGMIAITSPEHSGALQKIFNTHNIDTKSIGTVTRNAGITYTGALI